MKKDKFLKLNYQDVVFAGINGLIFGLLLPVVLNSFNVKINFPYWLTAFSFTLLAVIGVYIGFLLSKIKLFFFQLAKFGATGAANFAIDIGILALLITIFFREAPVIPNSYYAIFKIISFSLATVNSYLWNKFWSFNDKDTSEIPQEIGKFILVSGIGLILNATIATLSNSFQGSTGVDPKTWAAISGVIGAVAVLSWNFIGYKFIVFKK